MVESLKDYLSLMEKSGQVLRIKKRVHRDDIPELIDKLSGQRKILLFEAVENYTCQLVANLAPSHDAFKQLFETDNPYEFFVRGIQKTEKTIKITDKKLQSITMTGGKDLLDFLPVLKYYENDSAPYITSGIVSSIDPDTGVVGRGIHRMEYRGGNCLGVALLNPPLTTIYQKYLARKTRMPLSITIGVDPSIFISMALKPSLGVDKLELAGGLKG